MKIVRIVATIAMLAGPAYAQGSGAGGTQNQKSPQQIQSERDAEKAYKRSLSNIPDQGPVDPWGSTRSDNAPKAANAPVKPTKRSSTGN
jgi:hypothetical protein